MLSNKNPDVIQGSLYFRKSYAPCLSSVFQFEFRDEKQKEFPYALLN